MFWEGLAAFLCSLASWRSKRERDLAGLERFGQVLAIFPCSLASLRSECGKDLTRVERFGRVWQHWDGAAVAHERRLDQNLAARSSSYLVILLVSPGVGAPLLSGVPREEGLRY